MPNDTPELSSTYKGLLSSFPPRPIKQKAEALSAQRVIQSLLELEELNQDQEDYLEVLTTLLAEYEDANVHIQDMEGIELLKELIKAKNLRQKDLVSIFKTESIVSDVLNGHRKLNVEHIQKLSDFFNISPIAFFPRNTTHGRNSA